MPLVIKILSSAENDLDNIFLWTINHFGENQAKKYLLKLKATLFSIGSFGDQSKKVKGQKNLYELVFYYGRRKNGHRIFWLRQQTHIEIIRIIHTARDWRQIMGEK